MQIITTREFRANQKKYFEMAEKETILVSRRHKTPIAIYAPSEDDFLTATEVECIQRGLQQKAEGKLHEIKSGENLDDFMSRMKSEGNV